MDDFGPDLANGSDEAALLEDAENQIDQPGSDSASSMSPSRLKRHVFRRGIFKAASIQDKLLEKLISQAIPPDPSLTGGILDPDPPDTLALHASRPGFTVSQMTTNFRRFNARIGVMFKFQTRVIALLSWRRPTQTLSLLAVHTFACLDPYLLVSLPLIVVLVAVFIPSFIARHPAAPESEDRLRDMDYRPRGPPLAPAVTVKPVKELSRDFFRNLGHLQNGMEDFTVLHDQIVGFAEPKTNFADEELSSGVFVLLCGIAGTMSVAAHLLPWRFLCLVAGWVVIVKGHPVVAGRLKGGEGEELGMKKGGDYVQRLADMWREWVRRDIVLDSAPETREVEIFELQRLSLSGTGEWEPWVFSPSPYDPLSAGRIAGKRPAGTRFFEDVMPPPGWEWSEKKWALDLWSREWVEERIITGVEVETEGERWVYDIYDEHEGLTGVLETPLGGGRTSASRAGVSWEEGEEGMGRRGEWRRRRWVRLVKRKKVAGTG